MTTLAPSTLAVLIREEIANALERLARSPWQDLRQHMCLVAAELRAGSPCPLPTLGRGCTLKSSHAGKCVPPAELREVEPVVKRCDIACVLDEGHGGTHRLLPWPEQVSHEVREPEPFDSGCISPAGEHYVPSSPDWVKAAKPEPSKIAWGASQRVVMSQSSLVERLRERAASRITFMADADTMREAAARIEHLERVDAAASLIAAELRAPAWGRERLIDACNALARTRAAE